MPSVLQDWVLELGLRHQGVLVAMTRGCDGVPKEDPSKVLTRVCRGTFLVSFSPNPTSFIERMEPAELRDRMTRLLKNIDHYPLHFIMHFAHAAEIIGFKHPDPTVREVWRWFYGGVCRALHVNPESEDQLDKRLSADEETFRKMSSL